jgi:hypothetical protein
VHDHAITEEVPSALSASRRERASGFPSIIQFGQTRRYKFDVGGSGKQDRF